MDHFACIQRSQCLTFAIYAYKNFHLKWEYLLVEHDFTRLLYACGSFFDISTNRSWPYAITNLEFIVQTERKLHIEQHFSIFLEQFRS